MDVSSLADRYYIDRDYLKEIQAYNSRNRLINKFNIKLDLKEIQTFNEENLAIAVLNISENIFINRDVH